ncbi:MAG: Unknown protein [uncultured Sulfurovum sp.]|uniref:Uncharacterized protein n=1 Tax=uncultured Sulfurovum sp. TaxID=269237 RepID=A0A6S6SQQ4_9BACT|nr:MAG: Unknown protein [uncultured Sulfurovum sp.]
MKKFLLYLFAVVLLIAAVFTYLLYQEGVFDEPVTTKSAEMEPFMKCEAGKCAVGKCAGAK